MPSVGRPGGAEFTGGLTAPSGRGKNGLVGGGAVGALPAELALASALLHLGWNTALRRTAGNLRFLCQQTLAGGVLGVCIALVVGSRNLAPAAGWLAATVLIHAVYFWALASAYRRGALSVVYPLSRGGSVILVPALAVWWFAEIPGAWAWVGMALVAVGMMGTVLARGVAVRRDVVLWALLVALTITGYSLVDSHAMHLVTPPAYVAAQFLGAGLLLAPMARRVTAEAPLWMAMLSGAASLVSYLLLLYAYQLAPVGPVLALRQLAPALAPPVGWLFLRERLSWAGAAGALSVAAGGALLIWH